MPDDTGPGSDLLSSLVILVMMVPLYWLSRQMKETGGTANYLWLKYRRWLEDDVSRLRLGRWLAGIMVLQTFALSVAVFFILSVHVSDWAGEFLGGDAVPPRYGLPMWISYILLGTCFYICFALCMPIMCSATAMYRTVVNKISDNEEERRLKRFSSYTTGVAENKESGAEEPDDNEHAH